MSKVNFSNLTGEINLVFNPCFPFPSSFNIIIVVIWLDSFPLLSLVTCNLKRGKISGKLRSCKCHEFAGMLPLRGKVTKTYSSLPPSFLKPVGTLDEDFSFRLFFFPAALFSFLFIYFLFPRFYFQFNYNDSWGKVYASENCKKM